MHEIIVGLFSIEVKVARHMGAFKAVEKLGLNIGREASRV
jgi:hypothetical protein